VWPGKESDEGVRLSSAEEREVLGGGTFFDGSVRSGKKKTGESSNCPFSEKKLGVWPIF